MSPTPTRLGFAVKVMGAELPSNDARRWQNNPHLRVSLGYLDAILDYLDAKDIRMYRISSELAPYLTHPDMPQFHNQLEESAELLAGIGAKAKRLGIRLSFHPSQYILLNAQDEEIARKSVIDLQAQARMLDMMEQGPDAVVVTHVGGVYGDRESSRQRFIERYLALDGPARRRLVVENDDKNFSVGDVMQIHEATGIPVVFDNLHHHTHNPDRVSLADGLNQALTTWPAGMRPKVHFSSPRTEMRTVKRTNAATGKSTDELAPPLWTQHSDYLHPFEFIEFGRLLAGREVDVMLEAKLKDMALLRLRADLRHYAPDLATQIH